MAERRIVNTSPMVYLARAGFLRLLQADCDEVLVPTEVAAEVSAWPTADAAALALSSHPWIKKLLPEPIPGSVAAWDLGKGESSVFACGLSRPGHTLVLDDLAARRCARAMGLPVRGTLGFVLRDRKMREIPSARKTLKELRDAGMYLADSVVELALREVGE